MMTSLSVIVNGMKISFTSVYVTHMSQQTSKKSSTRHIYQSSCRKLWIYMSTGSEMVKHTLKKKKSNKIKISAKIFSIITLSNPYLNLLNVTILFQKSSDNPDSLLRVQIFSWKLIHRKDSNHKFDTNEYSYFRNRCLFNIKQRLILLSYFNCISTLMGVSSVAVSL